MSTIKDEIKAGAKPSDLYAAFMKELDTATREVEQEKKDAESDKIEEARDKFIDAFLDYSVAVGWIDEDLAEDDELWDDFEDTLKREEKKYIKYTEYKDDDIDAIIKNFIKYW